MFLTHFPHFGGKKTFSWKIRLSHTTSYGFLAPCQNLGKANDTIQRKRPDRWKDERTGRRTERPYFMGPLIKHFVLD